MVNILYKKLKRFVNDTRGIAYVWVVAVCTLIIGTVLFWVMGLIFDAYTANLFGTYSFSGITLQGWILVKAIAAYGLPISVLITVLLWSWVQSKMQRYGE